MGRIVADLATRRAKLLAARARIDRELADLDAGCPPAAPGSRQDGRGPDPASLVTLKAAAHAWGVSAQAAHKRARKLEPLGLAVRLRPGGWRVSAEALVADASRTRPT